MVRFQIIGHKVLFAQYFKTGSLSNPNNFRGVSLIDVLNKSFTGMMNNRVHTWAEDLSKTLEKATLQLISCSH